MVSDAQRAVIERLVERGFNRGDLAAVDEVVAEDVIDHSAAPHQAQGIRGVKERIDALRRGFPDLHMQVEDLIADGDRVVFRYTVSGTFTGELPFAQANGKHFSVTGINIERVKGGRIVERWSARDDLLLNKQLGIG
jgi:steroid delta-isomerase-like uncharacterized protein